jgi:uncharacterized repeat protein (TIGR01451 family)
MSSMKRHLLLLAMLAALAKAAAAPLPDAGASRIYDGTPSSANISANYTVSAGTNQLLLVVVECEACSAPSSVKYGGTSMTLALASTNANLNLWTYDLIAPTTGVSLPVAVTLGSAYYNPANVFAFSYSGVNQTTPLGNTAQSDGATNMSSGTNTDPLAFTASSSSSTVLEVGYERAPGGAAMSVDHGAVRFTSNNTGGNVPGDFSFGDWQTTSTAAQSLKYIWSDGSVNTSNYTVDQAIELMPAITVTFTPTPSMPLVKTINVPSANVGDTVTYCLNWTNNSSAVQSFSVWDTVSPYITYMGCISGCAQSGNVLSWNVVSAASGATGTFCFWGTVNAYPMLPVRGIEVAALPSKQRIHALFFPLEN